MYDRQTSRRITTFWLHGSEQCGVITSIQVYLKPATETMSTPFFSRIPKSILVGEKGTTSVRVSPRSIDHLMNGGIKQLNHKKTQLIPNIWASRGEWKARLVLWARCITKSSKVMATA